MNRTHVLIYIEDPGAANYLADIPAQLVNRGLSCTILVHANLLDYPRLKRVPVETVHNSIEARDVIATVSPFLLLIGTSENPDSLGLKLVTEARALGIESIGVIDAFANADYRFRGYTDDPLRWAPDWLLVPDKLTQDVYIQLGYHQEQIIICRNPHFDHVRSAANQLNCQDRNTLRDRLFPGLSDDKKVVVFAAEVSTGLNPDQFQYSADYTLTGRGTSTGRTEIVIEAFLDTLSSASIDPYLVLRLHPKNTRLEYEDYLDEFDKVSEGGSPLEEIYAADLVVGMTSVLLVEAALMGTSTLSIVPRDSEKSWLPDSIWGVTPIATKTAEIKEHLFKLLYKAPAGPVPCLHDHIPPESSIRVADFIESLCRPGKH